VPEVANNGGLTNFQIAGLNALGASGYMPTLSTITSFELIDNVTKVRGSHFFKGGFQWDRIYGLVLQPPWGRGQFNYSGQYSDVINVNTNLLGIADMLIVPGSTTVPNGVSDLGSMSSFQASNVASNQDVRYYYGVIFQDDWKITPTLTVNLGLRWDTSLPIKRSMDGRPTSSRAVTETEIPARTTSLLRAVPYRARLPSTRSWLPAISSLTAPQIKRQGVRKI